ncbi:MAG: response regulator [Planctomyces sp.]|nr:response regulator [Planctomyces sp.]
MEHPKVLIIDSDRESVRQLHSLLSTLPLDVLVAVDQVQAFERNLSHSFDLMFISHGLQDGNGVKLFTQLRQANGNVCGVLMASHVDLRVVYDAVSAGFAHVLEKPFEPAELRFVLGELFPDRVWSVEGFQTSGREPMEPVTTPDLVAIARLTTADIRENLSTSELIRIIRSVDYPFAGKERLEYFDRDTLERVVCLVRRWSQQRLESQRSSLKATA